MKKMDKPKRFLECQFPVTICNLECPYCYIIQENRRKMQKAELIYSPEYIAKALRKERLGGVCWINICGAGETLIQDEVIDIIQLLLEEGHYLNITTNGTLDRQFDALIEKCKDYLNHLHIAFSWHFLELKKRNLTDRFFTNIIKMKNAGASILLQINLCDEYVPYIDEIKNISILYDGFSETDVDLQCAMEQLPKNQRNVIILKFMYMMPDKEIMEKLKLSRQSVYKNKIKGLEKLKEILKDL